MLDPSEVINGKCHLAIYRPYYTSIHCDTKDFEVDYFTIFPESLVDHGVRGEEEDNYGANNSIDHPTRYAGPAEEYVIHSLFI